MRSKYLVTNPGSKIPPPVYTFGVSFDCTCGFCILYSHLEGGIGATPQLERYGASLGIFEKPLAPILGLCYLYIAMKNISYTTLQKKYPGKLVALLEKKGDVVASGKNTQELEKALKKKGVDPRSCLFLGPIERYKQISVY